MWNVIIGCAVTIIASWLFSKPATRQLKLTTRVLAGYLEGTIKGQDITFNRDKKGNVTGLNYTLHVDSGSFHIQSSDEVKLTVGNKNENSEG
jgi:hypothetical protein